MFSNKEVNNRSTEADGCGCVFDGSVVKVRITKKVRNEEEVNIFKQGTHMV